MQTTIIEIDPNRPDKAQLCEAAKLIDAGSLVAFPTETVYGIACRVDPESLSRLSNLKGRTPDKHYTLHIGRKEDVHKYVPAMSLRAEKLVRSAWPGPLTIVFELSDEANSKLKSTLPDTVFENLYKQNTIGIRCPDNAVAATLLQLTHQPVVAPSANITGQPPSVSPDQVLAQFSGQIELLLDAGPCKHKKSSTVVKLGQNGLDILRQGVYTKKDLEKLSKVQFLFVCTGNTCRSPMAEGIFGKYLAEKLHCDIDQIKEKGYKVHSAGTIDLGGFPASPEAVEACAARGINISRHRSTALTEKLINDSDVIYALTRSHRDRVIGMSPEAEGKCFLLLEDRDIPDPIGRPQEAYNDCAEVIDKAVKQRIGRLNI